MILDDGSQVELKCKAATASVRDKLYVCIEFAAEDCKLDHRRRCFDKVLSIIEGVMDELGVDVVLKQYEQEAEASSRPS